MSRLEDMLALSRKLAAGTPGDGDKFVWTERDLSEETARFLFQDDTGPGLVIDPSLRLLETLSNSGLPFHIVWSDLEPPKESSLTEVAKKDQIQASRRRPTDLAVTLEGIQKQLEGASDLGGFQDMMSGRRGEASGDPWLPNASCAWVAAPYVLNTLFADESQKALAEFARVVETSAVLRCLVLAADEPGAQAPLSYAGHTLIRIPTETDISSELAQAGFHGITLTPILNTPVMTSNGAELRLLGVEAFLGTSGICLEQGDAAVYLGPWKSVTDDDGHTYPRGVRIAVCEKTARVLSRPPYQSQFLIIKAYGAPSLDAAEVFDCSRTEIRSPAETKGRAPISGAAQASPLVPSSTDCGPDCKC